MTTFKDGTFEKKLPQEDFSLMSIIDLVTKEKFVLVLCFLALVIVIFNCLPDGR